LGPRITVVGSFIMDLVIRAPRRPERGETLIGTSFGMFPGGKGANQAVAAARLGAEVAMIGRLGNDDFGRTFLQLLKAEGINTSGIVVDEGLGTGIGNPVVEDSGDNSIIIVPQANSALCPADVEKASPLIEQADVLLVQLEVPIEASFAAARIARQAGAKVILNPAPYRELPAGFLKLVDILVPNEVEFAGFTGRRAEGFATVVERAKPLLDLGPQAIVVTVGAAGCYLVGRDNALHIPAQRVNQVVDTTAAGDAFCGALAWAIASGQSLREACTFANKVAAAAITKLGAISSLPRANEL